MTFDAYQQFCLALPGTSSDYPFDERTLVFRVADKIFALTNFPDFESINLKCEPEAALELRARYSSVQPGYHMNKRHWNTVLVHGELTDAELQYWTRHAYEQVLGRLPRRLRDPLWAQYAKS